MDSGKEITFLNNSILSGAVVIAKITQKPSRKQGTASAVLISKRMIRLLKTGVNMTAAPLASTIVAVGLIPVAFLFCHAFLSGRSKNRFHPVSGAVAIIWDLTVSIGYMLYRTFGGAVDGSTLQLTPTLDVYFGMSRCSRNSSNDSGSCLFSPSAYQCLTEGT